ncbi:hypothetical protein EDB92DRAFT_1949680 [Lactarius akahatsu]|uniref:Uncharacterized protein n=1 Tax=Lactarius akahatsu TaxID=416441 RepID=A0AAD4LBT6_9AGAM|nr:hypothetical protein EDB92DRAFT_1949680 [Lactarius akahatsu]
MDDPDHLLIPHNSAPRTSLSLTIAPAIERLAAASTPRSTRPMSTRSTLTPTDPYVQTLTRRKRDYNAKDATFSRPLKRTHPQLARRSLPLPQKIDFIPCLPDPLLPPFNDSSGLSDPSPDSAQLATFKALRHFPTSSIPVNPSSNDPVAHDDSIRIEDPGPQFFSTTPNLAPSQTFVPLPSLTVALPSPLLSRSIDHSFPVNLPSRSDTRRLTTAMHVSPPAPFLPWTIAPVLTCLVTRDPSSHLPDLPSSLVPRLPAFPSRTVLSLDADLSGPSSASIATLDPRSSSMSPPSPDIRFHCAPTFRPLCPPPAHPHCQISHLNTFWLSWKTTLLRGE